jgi:3-dehydroquinate dehydratase II
MSKEGGMMSSIGKVLVLNGPNLNMLGQREQAVYGSQTLDDIVASLTLHAKTLNLEIEHIQSNHEGVLVDTIQQAKGQFDFIVINPAAYTHTSIAIRDALLAVEIPFVEVHLSNVHARESFRSHSYLSDIASGVICGLGPLGYQSAFDYVAKELTK